MSNEDNRLHSSDAIFLFRQGCFKESLGLSEEVKMRVYFSAHESLFYGKRETFSLGCLRSLFQGCEVIPNREHQHDDIVERFNLLSDCGVYVLLPKEWSLDETQKWEVKAWKAINRATYLITPEDTIIMARFEENICEIQK